MKGYLISCVVLLTAACASPPPAPDASPDGSPDGSAEASADASPDGSADSSPDAVSDGASMDVSADASAEAGLDASTDAGSLPDSGACSMYTGNPAWGAQLVVEPGARLCAASAGQWSSMSPSETLEQTRQRSLVEMLAKKSAITVPAGTYALPTMSESRAFLLPMCVSDLSGARPVATAANMVNVTRVEGGIGRDNGIYVESTFGLAGHTLGTAVYRPLTSATTATLSASPVGGHFEGLTARRSNNSLYVNCAIRANWCHNVAIPGVATVRIDEYHWAASPGQGLSVPLRLRASIDGAAIDLQSYESMTGVYGHHAFERTFWFRFANPVRGACGLRVDMNLDAPASVYWTACDATPMGSAVSAPTTMISCT